jgi:hypothetical protein
MKRKMSWFLRPFHGEGGEVALDGEVVALEGGVRVVEREVALERVGAL